MKQNSWPFYLKNQEQPISSKKILIHLWPDIALGNPNSTIVKRYISSLRKSLSLAFSEYSGNDLIRFEQSGYKIYLPIEVLVFKGVNFALLTCH